MKKYLSKKFAGQLIMACLTFMLGFHFLVIIKVLPTDVVWAGSIENESQVIVMEIVAFIITAFFMLMGAIKVGFIRSKGLRKVANIVIWIMVVYFALIILGNIMAKTVTEKIIFIPLSVIMFVSALRLAVEREENSNNQFKNNLNIIN